MNPPVRVLWNTGVNRVCLSGRRAVEGATRSEMKGPYSRLGDFLKSEETMLRCKSSGRRVPLDRDPLVSVHPPVVVTLADQHVRNVPIESVTHGCFRVPLQPLERILLLSSG